MKAADSKLLFTEELIFNLMDLQLQPWRKQGGKNPAAPVTPVHLHTAMEGACTIQRGAITETQDSGDATVSDTSSAKQ